MTDDEARTPVAERLADLRAADESLGRWLEAVAAAASKIPERAIDREPLASLDASISSLREPPPAEVESIAAVDASSRQALHADEDSRRPSPAQTSAVVQAAYVAVGHAAGAAAGLFTTGRLMFVGAACDFAATRMKSYAEVTKALNGLLPQVVAWELREEGLPCHCVCPMCGLGACGCIWASLHNIDMAWGGPGLAAPDERGIPLRSPPRPGSQLAAAGVGQWDRVTEVDDEPVRSPSELQTALRRHAIGDDVRLRVERNGKSREIVVRHASDLP